MPCINQNFAEPPSILLRSLSKASFQNSNFLKNPLEIAASSAHVSPFFSLWQGHSCVHSLLGKDRVFPSSGGAFGCVLLEVLCSGLGEELR